MSGPRTAERFIGVGLFLLFWSTYQFSIPHAFSYDGLCYALDVERAGPVNWFHPNHLFYTPIARFIVSLSRVAGYSDRAIYLMQSMNAFVGAGAVASLAILLIRAFGIGIGTAGALLLGLSRAFWSETVDPGCYAWATLATVAVLSVLCDPKKHRPVWMGLVHGAAILFHQMLFLVAPAFLWRLRKDSRAPQAIGLYLGTMLATVGVPYAWVAFQWHGDSFRSALQWMLAPAGPTPGSGLVQGSWWRWTGWENVSSIVRGFVESLVIVPDTGLANAVIVLALIGLLVGTLVRAFSKKGKDSEVTTSLWIWIGALTLFQLVWAPGTIRFRLLWLPAWIYLVTEWIASWPESKQKGLVVALVVMVTALNVPFFLSPARRQMPGRDYLRADWVAGHLSPNDFFLFAGVGEHSITNVYVAYFAPAIPARSLWGYLMYHPGSIGPELQETLRSTTQAGGQSVLEAALFDPEIQDSLEKSGRLSAGAIASWLANFQIKRERMAADGYRVFEVSETAAKPKRR